MSLPETILIAWSTLALLWWITALFLVRGTRRPGSVTTRDCRHRPRSLSIFKPLPPVRSTEEADAIAAAVETFLEEMDPSCELILGVPGEQSNLWRSKVDGWREAFPGARLLERIRATPCRHANPKVAWLAELAPEATGEDWLWSDADIIAPPGFLDGIRASLGSDPRVHAITVPYCIRRTAHPAGWLEALFVNVEFLPGTLLLRRTGPVAFGFGAAMLFRSDEFRRRVSWDELGASLADDHELGRHLAPVRIDDTIVETCALESKLFPAVQHLHRWQRTIRWCQPGGSAALVVLFPLFGFVGALLVDPRNPALWTGLGFQYLAELLVVHGLLKQVGFSGPHGGRLLLAAWPALRCLIWLSAWLPLPVVWKDLQDSWSSRRRPPRGPST